MPKGILYIEHDELKGPIINTGYLKGHINIPAEFISKLYMSHAGFESTSTMEFKMQQYKIISCYTGNKSRKSKTEGILALILDEEEEINNIELYLKRYLDQVISNPSEDLLREIITDHLHNYILLGELFDRTEIEGIPAIHIIQGKNNEYRNTILSLGSKTLPRDELIQIFKMASNSKKSEIYPILELENDSDMRTFIVSKSPKRIDDVSLVLQRLKPYLDAYPYFAAELCALFLIPTLITVKIHDQLMQNSDIDDKSVYKVLKRAENYNLQFQFIASLLVNQEIQLIPSKI